MCFQTTISSYDRKKYLHLNKEAIFMLLHVGDSVVKAVTQLPLEYADQNMEEDLSSISDNLRAKRSNTSRKIFNLSENISISVIYKHKYKSTKIMLENKEEEKFMLITHQDFETFLKLKNVIEYAYNQFADKEDLIRSLYTTYIENNVYGNKNFDVSELQCFLPTNVDLQRVYYEFEILCLWRLHNDFYVLRRSDNNLQ